MEKNYQQALDLLKAQDESLSKLDNKIIICTCLTGIITASSLELLGLPGEDAVKTTLNSSILFLSLTATMIGLSSMKPSIVREKPDSNLSIADNLGHIRTPGEYEAYIANGLTKDLDRLRSIARRKTRKLQQTTTLSVVLLILLTIRLVYELIQR
jgi:hypothetical protein